MTDAGEGELQRIADPMAGFAVYVFHFNRPGFLENAIASVERHLPGVPVTIMDDGSDSPSALRSLDTIGRRHKVVLCSADRTQHSRGGLHANIQLALGRARLAGERHVLMLQDDMQLVRPIDAEDRLAFERAFAQADASFVLSATFLKGSSRQRSKKEAFALVGKDISRRLHSEEDLRRYIAYSDVGIFDVERFFAMGGEMQPNERDNEMHLRERGVRLSTMTVPLMHYLPFPQAYRGRRRTLRSRVADWLGGAGIHRITDLTTDEVLRLRARNAPEPPYAEDWLKAPTAPQALYWSLHGGRSNLGARGGWRRVAARLF